MINMIKLVNNGGIMRFVLVHGGFHGAWCWDRLIPEIERLGHTSIAVDLPGHGKRANESTNPSLSDYRDAVLEILEPDDILVGHSMGGLIITLVADAAPEKIKHLIYISTILPFEGKSFVGGAMMGILVKAIMWLFNGLTKLFPCMAITVYEGAKKIKIKKSTARWAFFHDCSPEIIDWACGQLKHEYVAPMVEKVSVPRFWEAQLPRSLILGTKDNILGLIQRSRLFSKFIDRFGVQPVYIEASHSSFLSQPETCAKLMIETVGSKSIGLLKP